MKSQPALSTITIFLNAENTLDEAIESVVRQSFKDWELILVDDGSTDGSSAIASRWAQKLPSKIRRVEHPGHENRGMSAARNLGLAHARGEFVTFLDADDVWLRNPIERQIHLLNTHPDIAMTYGPTLWWRSWTGRSEDAGKDTVADPGLPAGAVVNPPDLLLLTLTNEGFNPAGILWRRTFVQAIGGYEDTFRGMYEDQAFYAKAFLRAKAYLLDESWYRYRKHDDGCCSVAVRTGAYHAARHRYLRWLASYLKKERVNDQDLWRVLRQQLLPYKHPILFRAERRLRTLRKKSSPEESYLPVKIAQIMDRIKVRANAVVPRLLCL